MKLKNLFKDQALRAVVSASMNRFIDANGEMAIVGITDDSRKIKPGYLFVAIKGSEHDGHSYVEQTINRGAVAVVFDVNSNFSTKNSPVPGRQLPISKQKGTVFLAVHNTRRILGFLWSAWYGFPSRKLKVIGVTGTDGKTTTANLIYHILRESGKKVGLISTISARIGEREIDTGFHVTNPEPELLQKLLSEMVEDRMEYAVLEVTSHGIDQERIAGIDFYAAVATNVTHEHLDYHKTYKAYLETKGRLFGDVQFGVLNRDDSSYNYLWSVTSGKIVGYGLRGSPEIMAKDIQLADDSVKFEILINGTLLYSDEVKGIEIHLGLPGIYNVYNALAAYAVCSQLGLTGDQIKKSLESFQHLEGRFDEVSLGQPFRVIVDFAHTPNALEQVLKLSLKLKTQNSKLTVVFGCAGERDHRKRPMMGEIAGRLADLSILTAEDPRREKLNEIIDEIAEGCKRAGAKERSKVKRQKSKPQLKSRNSEKNSKHIFVRIPDRRAAIGFAISNAGPGDTVLIVGKGHEKSMCFGTTEYPWSDKQAATAILEELVKV